MGVKEITVAGKNVVLHELDDVCDSVTGRALTGSWVWDSAFVLSEWMATQGQADFDLRGKTVLELGAGAGLPGLTAVMLGASRVVLTDLEPLVPGLARNVEANGLGKSVEVRKLVWGSDEPLSEHGALTEFDLVLMSDAFFDTEETEALSKTLKRACGEQTRVWAATEVRPWTRECLCVLADQGFGIFEQPNPLALSTASTVRDESSGPLVIFSLVPLNEANHVPATFYHF